MCISMNPGAEFSSVITAGFQVSHDVHVMAYQNKASSFYGPNCMLLHVPGENLELVPSQNHGDFMTSMGEVVPNLLPSMALGFGARGLSFAPEAASFRVIQYGAYEVVLADSARTIANALSYVSTDKRPRVNDELLAWYDENYPDCAFVLACFNNDVEVADSPIIVRYSPFNPDVLYATGLESHTGKPPALGAHGEPRGFKVVFGSLLADEHGNFWRPVDYRPPMIGFPRAGGCGFIEEPMPVSYGELDEILPERIVGFNDKHSGANEDYVVKINDVLSGVTGADLFATMPTHYEGSDVERFVARR